MHNSFLVFDFGGNEEAAQQARHKLEGWKQAFRLDKKLLYKFDRQENSVPAPAPAGKEKAQPAKPAAKTAKAKAPKDKAPKDKAAKEKPQANPPAAESAGNSTSDIKLLVRLYFSGHEKLSYQRWVERIPTEEPFKSVKHELVAAGDARFAEFDQQFESLD